MRISNWSSDVCSSDLGDSFCAQHVEQGVFVGVEVHAFNREIGAGFGFAFAPQSDFGGGAAHIIERADLGADRLDIEPVHGASLPSASASNARLPRRFHSASMLSASSPWACAARSSIAP